MKSNGIPYVAQISENACGAAALEMVYKYYGLQGISQDVLLSKYEELEPHGSGNFRMTTDSLVQDARARGFESGWARVNYARKNDAINLLIPLIATGIPIIVCKKFTDAQPQLGHFR